MEANQQTPQPHPDLKRPEKPVGTCKHQIALNTCAFYL